MFKTVLSGLKSHSRRLIASSLAVALGVSFVIGTLVFTNTLKLAMIQSFAQGDQNISVAVLPRVKTSAFSDRSSGKRPELPLSMLNEIKSVPGVEAISGQLIGPAVILDSSGHAFSGRGSQFGVAMPSDSRFKWIEVTSGHAPINGQQVAVDSNTLATLNLTIGDTIKIVGISGLAETYTIVGEINVGLAKGFQSSSVAAFVLPTAEIVTGATGYREIDVIAKPGISQTQLATNIANAIGPSAVVETGAQKTLNDENSVIQRASAFENALLSFAVISIIVAALVIANTFRVLVTQRSRELALLRLIGASKKQVFFSIILESGVVGFIASIVGIFIGLLIAFILHTLFKSIGAGLPSTSLQLSLSTIIYGILVGTVTTVVASLLPARTATKVSPIAAFGSYSDTNVGKGFTKKRIAWAIGSLLLGGFLILANLGANASLPMIAIGGGLILVSYMIFGPLFVKPLATFLSFPFKSFSVTTNLGKLNTIRNPSRAASTSAALTIGLTLVTLFSVVASSLTASISSTILKNFPYDFIVTSAGANTVPPTVVTSITKTNSFQSIYELRTANMEINGISVNAAGLTPNLLISSNPTVSSGSITNFTNGNSVVLSDSFAKKHKFTIGSVVTISVPPTTITSKTPSFPCTVIATVSGVNFFNSVNLPVSVFTKYDPSIGDDAIFLKASKIVPLSTAASRLQSTIDSYPLLRAQNVGYYVNKLTSNVNKALALFTALLALALLISFIGIANTLSLSIFERTKEIGLLRALGLTRTQISRMLKFEGILLATIGALSGITIGILASYGIVLVLHAQGVTVFSVPISLLVIYFVVAGLAGMFASTIPARRAAKTSPVVAISYEG